MGIYKEDRLVSRTWTYDKRTNGLRVLSKLTMAKVKYIYVSECDESEKSIFVASKGWVNNFKRRYGFSLHHKKTTVQQDPERLIGKLKLILKLIIKLVYFAWS